MTLTINENDSKETIREKIELEKDKNKNLDYIIKYETDEPLPELDLKPDEFIQIKNNNKEVELNKGNLNLYIEDNDEISIKVDDPTNVNLSIKNQANPSQIKIGTTAKYNKKQNISIKANSELYQQLTLKIGDNVKSIKIDSIN